MELSRTLALRQTQRTLLYAEMLQAYEHLQDKYTAQKTELIEYKAQANYWSVQFKDLKSREEKLQQEVEELKATLRKREQQLFGKSKGSSPVHIITHK